MDQNSKSSKLDNLPDLQKARAKKNKAATISIGLLLASAVLLMQPSKDSVESDTIRKSLISALAVYTAAKSAQQRRRRHAEYKAIKEDMTLKILEIAGERSDLPENAPFGEKSNEDKITAQKNANFIGQICEKQPCVKKIVKKEYRNASKEYYYLYGRNEHTYYTLMVAHQQIKSARRNK